MNHTTVQGFDMIEAGPCTFEEAKNLAAQANAEAIGGFTDWVMPDAQTLRAMTVIRPRPDQIVRRAWASTHGKLIPRLVFAYVDFGHSMVGTTHKLLTCFVCLLRTSQCLDIGRAGQIESMRQAGIEVGTIAVQANAAIV